jgi:hypothetical protein
MAARRSYLCLSFGLLLLILLASCRQEGRPNIRLGVPIVSDCGKPADLESWFSTDTLAPAAETNVVRERFVSYLEPAGERPFGCGDSREGYRVTWLPTNRPAQIATIVRDDRGWMATATRFDDPRPILAGSPPRTVERRSESTPEGSTVAAFIDCLAAAKLWTAPAWQASREADDGDFILLELRAGGTYRALFRAQVTDINLQEVASTLLTAAGLSSMRELTDWEKAHHPNRLRCEAQSSAR